MVARYSLGKGKPAEVEARLGLLLDTATRARLRLLELVSLDSEAYLAIREARSSGEKALRDATARAAAVPGEVAGLCRDLAARTGLLRQEGNPYLLSDVVAAEKFLEAGAGAAGAMVEANQ